MNTHQLAELWGWPTSRVVRYLRFRGYKLERISYSPKPYQAVKTYIAHPDDPPLPIVSPDTIPGEDP